jgi:hypothetical protein
LSTVNLKKIGDMFMHLALNTVPTLLTTISEGVWDIGTKVVAA